MKKLIVAIYLIFFGNFLTAEIIKKIEITGNERISDETVKVYGDVSINQNVDNSKINEIIKNLVLCPLNAPTKPSLNCLDRSK